MTTTTTRRPTEAICPPWCAGHEGNYQPWEHQTDGSGQERDHAAPPSSFGPVEVGLRQTEDSRHVLGAPVVDIYVNREAGELTAGQARTLARHLTEAADRLDGGSTIVEVRQAVERLSRLDKAGALAAEEASDIRDLLAYVTGGQR